MHASLAVPTKHTISVQNWTLYRGLGLSPKATVPLYIERCQTQVRPGNVAATKLSTP